MALPNLNTIQNKFETPIFGISNSNTTQTVNPGPTVESGTNPTQIPPSKLITEYAFNQHLHELEIFITNSSGSYSIAPTSILSLTIENTLSNWVVNGQITVKYDNELAEFLNGNFAFRNDGSDFLRIRIIPLNFNTQGLPSLNLDKKVWELNYIFSIYNTEDTTPQTGGNSPAKTLKKYKKFSFWDIRYQKMLTNRIEYSTATSNLLADSVAKIGSNSDDTRSLDTDLAIYDIIKKSLNNDKLLSKTGREQDPHNSWDKGATRIFYTATASGNAYEDLMYVYNRHTSNTNPNDVAILDIEKGNNDIGYFTLRSLSKYFQNAGTKEPGPFQLEHFYLQADTRNKPGVGTYRSPRANIKPNTDLTFRDYSNIIKYEFVDIAPIVDSTGFVTTPVYSFDFKNRQYNVEFQNSSVTNAEKYINNNYINNLFKRNNTFGNNFLLQTDSIEKQKNYSVKPVYSLYGDSTNSSLRAPDGLHRLLRTGVFQNTCINFTVLGLTIREPGRFIAIDRPEGSLDGTFDDKLCGQWFVINVIHTFSNGAYYNNITAVKIHRYQSINLFDTDPTVSSLIKYA